MNEVSYVTAQKSQCYIIIYHELNRIIYNNIHYYSESTFYSLLNILFYQILRLAVYP